MSGVVWNDTRHRWEIDYYELAASLAEADRVAARKARRRAARRAWCRFWLSPWQVAGHLGARP